MTCIALLLTIFLAASVLSGRRGRQPVRVVARRVRRSPETSRLRD
ncbi:MAG: hypothetical protein ACTHNM_15955 [Dyella sp.]